MATTIFTKFGDAKTKDGKVHRITVVGKLVQKRTPLTVETKIPVEVYKGKTVTGDLKFTKKVMKRELTVGFAICHPDDEFIPEYGEYVALRRIEEGEDFGKLETGCSNMLTDDMVGDIISCKLAHIQSNINKFI